MRLRATYKGLCSGELLAYIDPVHTVGRHLLLELYDCDRQHLDSIEVVRAALREVTALSGATIVGESYHRFEPHGVSASLLVAESHVSLHTWPEAGYAAADFFTCGELDPRPGLASLARALAAGSHRMVEIVRGLAEDLKRRPDLPADAHRITRLPPCLRE
jgi:S-adenosylmethionine decarboxylase